MIPLAPSPSSLLPAAGHFYGKHAIVLYIKGLTMTRGAAKGLMLKWLFISTLL